LTKLTHEIGQVVGGDCVKAAQRQPVQQMLLNRVPVTVLG